MKLIFITMMILVGAFSIIVPLIFSDSNSDTLKYKHDFTIIVNNSTAKCSDLLLIRTVVGNGIWSLDENESSIHQQADDRLAKGNCTK